MATGDGKLQLLPGGFGLLSGGRWHLHLADRLRRPQGGPRHSEAQPAGPGLEDAEPLPGPWKRLKAPKKSKKCPETPEFAGLLFGCSG